MSATLCLPLKEEDPDSFAVDSLSSVRRTASISLRTPEGTFDSVASGPLFYNSVAQFWNSISRIGGEALANVRRHDDTVVRGDTKESKESYPNSDVEVDGAHVKDVAHVRAEDNDVEKPGLAPKPEQHEASRPCDKHVAED